MMMMIDEGGCRSSQRGCGVKQTLFLCRAGELPGSWPGISPSHKLTISR